MNSTDVPSDRSVRSPAADVSAAVSVSPGASAEQPDKHKYDHSDHPTHRSQRGDLNSPGQVNERGEIGPSESKERPSETPKHRG